MNNESLQSFTSDLHSRFGSVVAHPVLDGEVSGSSPGHTKDFKNGTYCSSACAGHNERRSSYLIQWTSKQSWLSDKIKDL